MKKKMLSIMLVSAMVLAACGQKTTGTPSGGGSNKNGGDTVVDTSDVTGTLKVMGYERNIAENVKFANTAELEQQKTYKAMMGLINGAGIELEFEVIADQEQYKTTVQTRLSTATDLPDLVCLNTMSISEAMALADNGIILPINEILEITKGPAYQYFYGGEGDRARKLISDEDGNFYWLPRIQMNMLNGEFKGCGMSQCIRKDWLDRLGMEMPKSLDEFTACLQAFQDNDMNGNGMKDEMLIADTSTFSNNGINFWFDMVSDYVGVNVTDKKVESPWYSPHIKEYFAYIQELNKKGLLYAEAVGTDDDTTTPLQLDNRISSCYYYPIGDYMEVPMAEAGIENPKLIGILPFGAVDGCKGFYSEETPYLVYLKYGVTNAAEDKLELVAKYFDLLYADECRDIIDWGVEGANYKVEADGTRTRTITQNFAERWKTGDETVDEYGRGIFPTIRHNERAAEIENAGKIYPEKRDVELETAKCTFITPNDSSGYYVIPTAAENEILETYTTDLSTYSREAAAKLSLGQMSVDEIDDVVKKLKELGLDEVMAVRQAQLDRGYAN